MKIAICSDIRQFDANQLRDRDWSRRFPGAGWVTNLFERQSEFGTEVASGDVALRRVKSGQWQAGDVQVVQELDAWHGRDLCRLGATPAVLTVFESPLVAYRSIDRLIRSRIAFAHCIGPRRLFEQMPAQRQARHWGMIFPCYWRDEMLAPVPWVQRKHTVLVAANKYWRERRWGRTRSTKDALRILRHGLRKRLSTTYRLCRHLQLHDSRLGFVEALASRNQIDVFGPGWENMGNLPREWAHRLSRYRTIFRGRCVNKFEVVRNYRFTVAYENTAYPGYITEKLIDGLVAAAVPVYCGAPDIADQVPDAVFINVRALGTREAVFDRMQKLTESEAAEMLAAGRTFLQSPQGQRHSYEGFAEWIVSLLHCTGAPA